MANDIQFDTAAPVQGLLTGVQQGMSAGMLIQQERRLQTQQKMAQAAAVREEQKNKAVAGMELLKQSWVPEDYKLMLYNQNVKPFFEGSKTPLPELTQWPNFGDKAAKELQDVITKGEKLGLPPAEIETMAAMALMKYQKEFQDMGKPVLESLRAQQASQDKQTEQRKAPSGYRWTADGNLEPIPGGPGKTPETIKADEAKNRVTGASQQLVEYYNELNTLGGITNVKKGTLANLWARAASSGVGQATANTFGTEAQSIRNKIYNMRPILIQEIRKATEMGAKGLDSAKELEFYLAAATDPKRDIQSNISALNTLDQAYGLGLGLNTSKSGGTSSYQYTATDASGKKVGWDGAQWIPISQ